jgi:hypothetical protein
MEKTAKLSTGPLALKLEDFGSMQARYSALSLPKRASAVLEDAQPALAVAQHILVTLRTNPKLPAAVKALRNNQLLTSRMRASEAKTALLDSSVDFIQVTVNKLSGWHKTMQRIANGEDKVSLIQDNIPEHLAMAMAGIASASAYLSILKLIVPELSKLDATRAPEYDSMLVEIRRCATVLSDCECASGLNSVIFH